MDNILGFLPNFTKTVELDKCSYVTPFLSAAFIPLDDCMNFLLSKMEMLSLRNMVWKAASAKEMFQSTIFEGKDSLKVVCWQRETTSYQVIADVPVVGKTEVLTGAGYGILDYFADLIRFPDKLLEKAGISWNYERTSLDALMARVYSTSFVEEGQRVSANRMQ